MITGETKLGTLVGAVVGSIKSMIVVGVAIETFIYGAIGAAGGLLLTELYKYVKRRIVKRLNDKKEDE